MTKFVVYIYIICVTSLVLPSCASKKKEGGQKAVTAKVQSSPYELLVVANKDWLKTAAGKSLVDVVETPIEGLPQDEPNFRVTYINPEAFKGTFKTYANILIADVGRKYEEPTIRQAENVYARPQQVLYVSAPDDEAFERCVTERGQFILNVFNQNEFARERAFLAKHHSGIVLTQAKKQFGVNIDVPKDIDEVKVGKNFLWASAGKQEFRLNVCLYTLPLRNMGLEDLVAARDSVMKVNIPGDREDQWMETDTRTVTSGFVNFAPSREQQVLTFRGLWDMRHDAMGGPFVCYVYPDYENDRILVAEGFVFLPEKKKRAVIRQLEAALQTVVLPTKE